MRILERIEAWLYRALFLRKRACHQPLQRIAIEGKAHPGRVIDIMLRHGYTRPAQGLTQGYAINHILIEEGCKFRNALHTYRPAQHQYRPGTRLQQVTNQAFHKFVAILLSLPIGTETSSQLLIFKTTKKHERTFRQGLQNLLKGITVQA